RANLGPESPGLNGLVVADPLDEVCAPRLELLLKVVLLSLECAVFRKLGLADALGQGNTGSSDLRGHGYGRCGQVVSDWACGAWPRARDALTLHMRLLSDPTGLLTDGTLPGRTDARPPRGLQSGTRRRQDRHRRGSLPTRRLLREQHLVMPPDP